jgi:hypothetical protein
VISVTVERLEEPCLRHGEQDRHVTPQKVGVQCQTAVTRGSVYNELVAKNLIHVSEAEAASDFATLLALICPLASRTASYDG